MGGLLFLVLMARVPGCSNPVRERWPEVMLFFDAQLRRKDSCLELSISKHSFFHNKGLHQTRKFSSGLMQPCFFHYRSVVSVRLFFGHGTWVGLEVFPAGFAVPWKWWVGISASRRRLFSMTSIVLPSCPTTPSGRLISWNRLDKISMRMTVIEKMMFCIVIFFSFFDNP